MAIANKKKFGLGFVMLIGFFVVLVLSFMPIWGSSADGSGKNMFNVLDDLYNSVSKGSSDFSVEVEEKAAEWNGKEISFSAKAEAPPVNTVDGMPGRPQAAKPDVIAEQMVKLVEDAGGTAQAAEESGKWTVEVSGDFGKILTAAVEDSKLMYEQKGAELQSKYGFDGQNALAGWWVMFNSPQSQMNKTGGEAFEQSKMLKEANEKSVEPAYNYFSVKAESPSSKALPILLSLGGYVLYTVWYGFSLLFMFEGWGLRLEH